VNKAFFESRLEEVALAFQVSVSSDKWKQLCRVYYQALNSKLSDSSFSDICSEMITKEEKFPTIAKFFFYRKMNYKPLEFKETSCYRCNGAGSVTGLKDGKQYCFRCDKCDGWTGRLSEQIPTWSNTNGFSLKNYEWDASDVNILKGLLILGKDSAAWRKAPEDTQQAALEFETGGWEPRNDIFECTEDNDKEQCRAQSIRREEKRYLDPTTGEIVSW